MRIISGQFSALSIDKNFILQYFIWNGLNYYSKNQLVNITGSKKTSLQQIEGNIFVPLEWYKDVSKKFNERKQKQNSNMERGSTNLGTVNKGQGFEFQRVFSLFIRWGKGYGPSNF